MYNYIATITRKENKSGDNEGAFIVSDFNDLLQFTLILITRFKYKIYFYYFMEQFIFFVSVFYNQICILTIYKRVCSGTVCELRIVFMFLKD